MGAIVAAPVEWVEAVSALRLLPPTDQYLQKLMDRNTEGLLTDAERGEFEAPVELSETLALV